MKIEVSIGEVFDKISILEIKQKKIKDEKKLRYVEEELAVLRRLVDGICLPYEMYFKLLEINHKIWDTEDIIRDKEKAKEFDEEFIKHARLDAKLNDERFLIKFEINMYFNSTIKEQKSYDDFYTTD